MTVILVDGALLVGHRPGLLVVGHRRGELESLGAGGGANEPCGRILGDGDLQLGNLIAALGDLGEGKDAVTRQGCDLAQRVEFSSLYRLQCLVGGAGPHLLGLRIDDDEGERTVLLRNGGVVDRGVGDAFLVVALDGCDGVVATAVVPVTVVCETHVDRVSHHAHREDEHEDDARSKVLGRQHPVGRQVDEGDDDGNGTDADGHQGRSVGDGGHDAVDGDRVEDAQKCDLDDPGPQRPGVFAAGCGDTLFSCLVIGG